MRKMSYTRILLMLFVLLAGTGVTRAQISLTATGGTTSGTYTTLSAAFAAIDSGTHTGVINISITGNTTEPATAGAASATLNGSGTGNASYTSVNIAPSGGSWTVSGAATAGFALIDLNGADNVTVSGGNNLTIVNTTASSTSGTSTVRFTNDATGNTISNTILLGGFTGSTSTNGGTIYFATQNATTATGNDNNTISGCNLGPVNATTLPSKAIYSNGTTTASANNNSGITITGNNIYDYFGAAVASAGIFVSSGSTDWTISNNKFYQTAARTQTTAGQHSAIWIANTSGNNFQITGNTIGYASSAGTGTYTFTGVASSTLVPIFLNVGTTTATSVQGNTITAIAMSGNMSGTTTTAPLRLIHVSSGLTNIGNVTGNTIGSLSATGAITYTSSSSSTGEIYAIYNVGSSAWNVSNNTIGGITGSTTNSGNISIFPIRANMISTVTFTCQNNIIGGTVANSIQSTSTASGSSVQAIQIFNGIGTVTGNIIRNMTTAGGTGTTSSASLAGIMTSSSSAETISGNTISNLSSTGASATIIGVAVAGGTTVNVNGNTISALSGTGATSPTISGIQVSSGTTVNVFKNKLYDFSETGAISTTSGAVNGIQITAGAMVNAYDNLIGDLRAPAASLADAIRGISVTSSSASTAYNVYYNSLYLNSVSSGTNFGTSGIYHAGNTTLTVATLDLRNNIIINTSTPAGTGITAAFRRSSSALANYAASSNRNLFYAGTPGAGNLIMYDGTNSYQTMAAYQAAVGTRDANSFGGETSFDYAGGATAFFTSTSGANANYLKPVAGISTQTESGGNAVSGIADDYSGATRPASGTAPDIGAWEFAGVSVIPVVTLNSITPGASALCTASARTVSVTATTPTGTISSVVLSYSFNYGTPVTVSMTPGSSNTWSGTIPAASLANAVVTWSVTATNQAGITNTYNGTTYFDEPLTGATATAVASATNICAGMPDTLTAGLTKNVSTTIGTGTSSISSSTVVGAFYGTWYGNGHAQILYTAAELTALGFSAGNFNSVSVPITALGSPTTLNGFTIKMANVSASSLTGFQAPSFTTVWGPLNYTPIVGTNTHTFTTAFVWDGISNVLVDYCFANSVSGNNSAVNTFTVTSFASFVNYNADGSGGSAACNTTTVSNLSVNRPNLTFTANCVPAPITYSWSNGTSAVSTANPYIFTPTASAGYTATITAGGCNKTTNTISVSVNPVPTVPTATNSSQCGTQIPTAAVADPNAFTAPVFKWYAAAAGGTALQASTSATYTTAVSATTTFYVSVTNPATGCESGRIPVTVTVSAPDAVTAKANGVTANTSSCLGSSISLTSVQTGTTNNYSYTWTATPATGSGIAASSTGQNISVTPTAAGIYTYTVTAVDGSCATASTVVDTVKNPFASGAVTATATPLSTCSGANDTLRAYYVKADTGTVGVQTTTDLTSGVYRYGLNTGDFKHQLLYTAAELNAAGFAAGNINALAFKVTSLGSGSGNNYTIKMSNVSATALTGTFVVPSSSTTVYTTAAYTPVSGLNQYTFSTPFNWDGTSNVLIDICYSVATIGSSSTIAVNTPAAVSNASVLGATGACTATSGAGTFTLRPLIWFSGNKNTLASAATWSNGTSTVGTGNPQVVNPLVSTNYTATVTLNGCSTTAPPVAVTIVPLSAATATATANTICAGQNDTLTASATGAGAPFTYSWSDGTAVVGTTKTIVVSPASTKTYTVTITNACSETATAAKTVTVNPIPTATAAGNSPVCEGGTLNLTGTTNIGTTFIWTGPNGFNTATQSPSITNVTTAASGVYTFKAIANGCTSPAATATVVINPTPAAVTVTPTTATICAGNIQAITASGGTVLNQPILSENFNAGTNSWTTVNNSTGGTTPAGSAWMLKPYPYSYSSTPFKSNDSSQFYISNSDTAGSGTITNTTLQSPAFSTVGAGNVYVEFYHNYKPWTAANDSATVEASSDGINWTPVKVFKTTASGLSNAFAHDTAYLTAFAGLPTVYVRYHYTATFGFWWAIDNVTVRGTVQPSLVWTPATGLYTDAAATVPYTAGANAGDVYAKPSATTTYTVSATSPVGCAATNTATITVNPLPNATVTGASALCVNATTTLTPTTTGGTWTSANTAVATVSSTGVVTGIAAGTDTIRYKVTNANGCTDSSFKVVTINALPNAAVTGASSVCINSTVTLTPTTTGGTWTSTNTAIATVSNTGVVTGVASGTDTIRYKVTNASGCTDSTFKVITVNAAPNAAVSGLTAICVNDTTTLTGATSGGTWTSSNTALATISNTGLVTGIAAGTDTITYTVNNGCTASATHIITIKPLPTLTVTADGPTTFCDGDSVKLTAHATGVTYQWSNAGGQIGGATDSVYLVQTSGVFTVTVSATNGCSNTTAPQTVTVNPLPVPVIAANGVDMTTGTFTTYQWNFGGNAISGATSQNYTATQNGDYTVTVTDGNGCAGTSVIYKMTKVGIDEHGGKGTIRIYPNPTKDVVYVDAPVPVNITVYSLDGRKIAYAEKAKSIDLGKFAAGAYTIMITDETASFKVVQRIVKAE